MSLATPERIRMLQRKLYVKAKGEPEFRFYLLYDKVWRADILGHAYRLCRANGGAAGVDGVTFERIAHRELLKSVARRISDRKMLRLMKMWLKVPVEETDAVGRKTLKGGKGSKASSPQGGVISPLLANIYIHRLLQAWKRFDLESKLRARIINYADDLVIVCRGRAEDALPWLKWITERLGLSLNEAKTCVRDAGRESFDFLGYTFGPMVYRRTGQTYLGVAPSKKRVKRFKESLRSVLHAGNHAPLDEVIEEVNRKLHGWAQYFSVGTLEPSYRSVDRYTESLLRKFLVRRHKVPGRGTRPFSNRYLYRDLGLVRLQDRRRVSRSQALT